MSEQNMTSEIASLRNENAVLKEELALANLRCFVTVKPCASTNKGFTRV